MSISEEIILNEVLRSPQDILNQYRKVQVAQNGPHKRDILISLGIPVLICAFITLFAKIPGIYITIGFSVTLISLIAFIWFLIKPGNQEMAKRHAKMLRIMVRKNEPVLLDLLKSRSKEFSNQEIWDLIFSGNEDQKTIRLAWTSFMDLVHADLSIFPPIVQHRLRIHKRDNPWVSE